MKLLDDFNDDPYNFVETAKLSEIVTLIEKANEVFFNTSKQIMTDAEYDLLKDELQERKPEHKLLKKIGSQVHTKNKVKLPVNMGSMDKIKPGTGNLDKWIKKYSGSYVLSDKLDGTSGLLVIYKDEYKLYTRGDGSVGTDISSIIKYINGIPNIKSEKKLIVRGELLVSHKNYEKNKSKYSNSRAMVNGLIGKKY